MSRSLLTPRPTDHYWLLLVVVVPSPQLHEPRFTCNISDEILTAVARSVKDRCEHDDDDAFDWRCSVGPGSRQQRWWWTQQQSRQCPCVFREVDWCWLARFIASNTRPFCPPTLIHLANQLGAVGPWTSGATWLLRSASDCAHVQHDAATT
jgi:hypothetical protein